MNTNEMRAQLRTFRLANKMMIGNPTSYVIDKVAQVAEKALDYIDSRGGNGPQGPGACGEKVLLTTPD